MKDIPNRMPCCGVRLCRPCGLNWMKRVGSQEMICFSCRRPVNKDSLKELARNGGKIGKGFALSTLGRRDSQNGKSLKAWKKFEQAAQLDDPAALGLLAHAHYFGYSYRNRSHKVQKSVEKAREYAKRGADQGDNLCNFILAMGDDIEHNEKIRLFSLAAYQGLQSSKFDLALLYFDIYGKKIAMYRKGLISTKDIMKSVILAIYWC